MFPSDCDLFLKGLWEGNKECVGINVENIALGNLINSHPVAAAHTFLRLMIFLWKYLFGIDMQHTMKKTKPIQLNKKGVFNEAIGCLSVIETQERDFGLHSHGVLWSKLSPSILTNCADIPLLKKRICEGEHNIITSN